MTILRQGPILEDHLNVIEFYLSASLFCHYLAMTALSSYNLLETETK